MEPGITSPLSEPDCTQLFEDLQANLSWQWDGRFQTALAQINMEGKDSIRRTLENHLGGGWTSASIDAAPDQVRDVLRRLGGIMPGQLLYAAGLPQDGFVFCAWWPWGNGQTISIRLGTNQEASDLLSNLVPQNAR